MFRVARALVMHEFLERTRDRWVLGVSVIFGLLATGVSLYARGAGAQASQLAGPSLVTLIGLVVPLVALILGHDAIVGERERNTLGLLLTLPVSKTEVVLAKFIGRFAALCAAVAIGIGGAVLLSAPQERAVLAALVGPTVQLGTAFLSLGVLMSGLSQRQITAASAVVIVWFLFVFFYDLGLLGLLIATDGQISPQLIATLVAANPAGLFRVTMMARFAGEAVTGGLPAGVTVPSAAVAAAIWSAWVLLPVAASTLLLWAERSKR